MQHGEILRVFFGVREKEDLKKLNGQLDGEYKAERLLKKITQDFKDSGIDGILSDNIKRDALTKFSYVSPIGTAGLYLHAVAGDFQREGEARELFKTLIREIVTLANAMGITFEEDLVERNLKILSNLRKKQRHLCKEMLWKENSRRLMGWYMRLYGWPKVWGRSASV